VTENDQKPPSDSTSGADTVDTVAARESSAADAGRVASGVAGAAGASADEGRAVGPARGDSRGGRAGIVVGAIGILIALAVGAWSMQRFDRIEGEVARRLQSAEQKVISLDATLAQSRDLLRDLQNRNAVLESKLAETAGLQAQVEKLFRDRAEDSLDVTLAEAESGLTLAAQQLALGAETESVLAALQDIDARLARQSDARLAPVRVALARDIEKLRVHPASDVGRLALRIDALVAALDQLPLLSTVREPAGAARRVAGPEARQPGESGADVQAAAPEAQAAAPQAPSAADRLGATLGAFGNELRELFRVRRIDSPEAVLVAPSEAYFLRQNLRLTLLNARLALLSRNASVYRSDLERARRWIESYYDGEHRNVIAVQNQLRQMLDAKLVLEPPRIDDSVAAVRLARTATR